jgi:hypothetical protein
MKNFYRYSLMWLVLSFCVAVNATAQKVSVQKVPEHAKPLLPVLSSELHTYWPEIFDKNYQTFPAGLIDQESNWKINAHLRTKREHGCGLGQFTIAYNADGSVRFDALEETKRLDKSLAGWNWNDCTNTQYQLRAVVLKLKSQQRDCEAVMGTYPDSLKCNAGKYNGGAGSVSKRIRLCRATVNCNPRIWDNNLSLQCPQSTVKVEGYGESFCEINSKYPGRVFTRAVKFEGYVK